MGTAFYPRAEVLGLRARLGLGGGPALSRRRWTDAELIALLRAGKAAGPVRTVADLVVETGISITRAEKVHRFWLRNDTWQAPEAVATVALSPTSPTSPTSASTERRRPDRISHDALIQQMRDPDPRVRAAAFDKLRPARPRHG